MYRILALNCLLSAYCLSVLYLDGVKFGDSQITAQAVLVSGLFFLISRSKPLDKLSHFQPPTSVFETHIVLSILGQFATTFFGLIYSLQMAERYMKIEIQEDD
jgi:cation-transporting ATPase 13A1